MLLSVIVRNSGRLKETDMTLIFFVCLMTSPNICHEERLSFSLEPVSGFGCMMGAPPKLAEWTNTHPQWRVARWKCIPQSRSEHSI
jgi:hypothetical protein